MTENKASAPAAGSARKLSAVMCSRCANMTENYYRNMKKRNGWAVGRC